MPKLEEISSRFTCIINVMTFTMFAHHPKKNDNNKYIII